MSQCIWRDGIIQFVAAGEDTQPWEQNQNREALGKERPSETQSQGDRNREAHGEGTGPCS